MVASQIFLDFRVPDGIRMTLLMHEIYEKATGQMKLSQLTIPDAQLAGDFLRAKPRAT